MNTLLRQTVACAAICISFNAFCQPEPEIDGQEMLCPNSTATYTTGAYDSYQWYVHPYGSNDTTPISGATSQTLLIDADSYIPCWLIVEVTEGGQTAMSEEFFVDGWAFLPPAVMSNGDFTIVGEGIAQICIGDTMYFEFMMPYNSNIVWYRDGSELPETSNILTVTQGGTYQVQGAPDICPDYVGWSLPLEVEAVDCEEPAGIGENGLPLAAIFPNPATDQLTIRHSSERITEVLLHDASGRLVQTHAVNQLSVTIDVSVLERGTYFATIVYGEQRETQPVSLR